MQEEMIKQELEKRFEFLKDLVAIKRKGRIFLELDRKYFDEVFDYLIKDLGFNRLSTITGLDEVDYFGLIYYLDRQGSIILNLKIRIPKDNPTVRTITNRFLNADIYEREIMDLLGIKVEGLAPGNRYPLPDNWPQDQFPLRKDWKVPVEIKEGPNA